MWFLASGEGPSDIGHCRQYDPCCDEDFVPGPMAWLADQVIEDRCHVSAVSEGLMYVLSEHALKKCSKKLEPLRLRGRNRPAETAYYFRNARALAQSLKKQLAFALGYSGQVPASILAELVSERKVDALELSMPSFVEFRERLEQVINPEQVTS